MKHIFDVDIANKYGLNAAILLESFAFWIRKNETDGTNYHDGNYWTFSSRKALNELFPYLSERQIGTAIQKLVDDGLIITGNYNTSSVNRTLWYALTEKGKSILHFEQMQTAKMSNAFYKSASQKDINIVQSNDCTEEVISVDNNTKNIEETKDRIYNKEVNDIDSAILLDNTNKNKTKQQKNFIPPTVEEVAAYCRERRNGINAEAFVDFYTSKGWMIGKNKMKDWKAAVRTWERTRRPGEKPPKPESKVDRENREMVEEVFRKMGYMDDE